MLNSVHLLLNLVFDSHFRVFIFFSVLANMNSMLFLAEKLDSACMEQRLIKKKSRKVGGLAFLFFHPQ